MTGLHVKNLRTTIFDRLSFDLPETGCYGIIGKNGIGKSTLFALLNGEGSILEGQIEVGRVAYIPNLAIFDKHLSAQDYLSLLTPAVRATFYQHLDEMGGADFLSRKIDSYSLGMKELFAFLFTLVTPSQVLIFDELLDGLDEQRRFAAYRLLKAYSQKRLILLTSHNLSEVFKVTDQVLCLTRTGLESVASLEVAQVTLGLRECELD